MDDIFKRYHALGFYLFPVTSSKIPYAGFKWRELSSDDQKQWAAWANQYKGCAWAIDCGKSNLAIYDVDPRNGGAPMPWLLASCEWVVQTPGGGWHFYYLGKVSSAKPAPGIDLQSEGKYVLCPPSPNYKLTKDISIVDLPEHEQPKALEEKKKFKVPEKILFGTRDEILFKEACSLVGQNHRPEFVRSTIIKSNDEICSPPLEMVQVEKIIKSAEKKRDGQKKQVVNIGRPFELWNRLGLSFGGNHQPNCNVDNGLRILKNIESIGECIWYDEFRKKILTTWNGRLREWADIDDTEVQVYFQKEVCLPKFGKDAVVDAVRNHAFRNRQNEFVFWLERLKWDGIKRIESFFPHYFGSTINYYTVAVSNSFWRSIIARGCAPGCQVDTMVILEGGQGKFKSSALRAIGGDWFSELHGSVKEKDFLLALQGKLILEIGEMESFNKAEINFIKGLITNRVDRVRMPYDKHTQDYPRSCIFVGTTNETVYLRDVTGGRRFLPMRCNVFKEKIALEELAKDRDQLFAEAFLQYKAGEKWWEFPDSTAEEQEARRECDEWEFIIKDYLEPRIDAFFKIHDIAKNALGIEVDKLDRERQKRIARCLTILGYERKHTKTGKIWVKL